MIRSEDLYIHIRRMKELQATVDSNIEIWKKENITTALHEEFHEWFNARGDFKDWKKNKTPKEKQLDELADCLAFTLSLMNHDNVEYTLNECDNFIQKLEDKDYTDVRIKEILNGKSFSKRVYQVVYEQQIVFALELILEIAILIYSFEELVVAYVEKSKINIKRQKEGY